MNCPFKNLFSCKEENNKNSIDDQYVKQMCKAVDRYYNTNHNYTYVHINENYYDLLKITTKFNNLHYKHTFSGVCSNLPNYVFINWPKPNSIIEENQNINYKSEEYHPTAKEAKELTKNTEESPDPEIDKSQILKVIENEARKHEYFVCIRRRNHKYDKEVKEFLESLGYIIDIGPLYIHVQ